VTDFTTQYEDLAALRSQWERSLQFGVLVADLSPEACEGDRANIRVLLPWTDAQVLLTGEVVEALGARSVTELDPFTVESVQALVAAGLAEAAGDIEGDEETEESEASASAPAEPEPTSAEPHPEPESVAAAEPSKAHRSTGKRATPFVPVDSPSGAEPSVSGSRSQGPVSQSPLSQGTPSVEDGMITEHAPEPTGDPNDIATIAAAEGPASQSTEVLLPPPTQHGDFAKISWREVLLHFYSQRATGVLVIEGFRESRWCYLLEGKPVHFLADLPHPGEFLSEVLVGEGMISSELWAEALKAQQVTGIAAGEYLVATGRLDRLALNQALSKRAQRITRKLMGMNYGTFRFHPYRELVGLFPFEPVPVLEVVLREQRAVMEALADDVVLSQASPLHALHCRLVLSRLDLLKELPLKQVERRLVSEVLPNNWVLSELVSLREMPKPALIRFLFSLKDLGLIEFVRDEGEGKERNRVERDIYSEIKAAEHRTEFEVLGVHWSSSPDDIQEGYRVLLERFNEASFGGLVDDKITAMLKTLEQLAKENLERISKPEQRRRLRRSLVGADEVRMAAELLQGHAKLAHASSDFSIVKACSLRVVDLSPEGREGGEMVARARKWLSNSAVSSVGLPGHDEMTKIRQDLARLK